MTQPLLVIIAGPNGSGKSTLIQKLRQNTGVALPDLYINADDLKIQYSLTDIAAQSLAEQLRKEAISQRKSLMFETVASHPSKIAELQQASLIGYKCVAILVATDSPKINVDRVAHRVRNGGHSVPEDKIRDRYQRTLALFPSMIELSTEVLVFDNTSSNPQGVSQTLQATLLQGQLVSQVENPARWVRDLIAKVVGRTEERQAIRQTYKVEMVEAILENGQYTGSILQAAGQYVLQKTSQQLVLHDRNLFPHGIEIEKDRSYSISYQQGVAQVDAVDN
jgi:predicted ABC-type ATPase